jgi:hypothetical protein
MARGLKRMKRPFKGSHMDVPVKIRAMPRETIKFYKIMRITHSGL